MMGNSKMLTKFLNEHPDRELVFMYPEENSDHYYTMGRTGRILVDEYVVTDERVWIREQDEDELLERIIDNISDNYWTVDTLQLSDELIKQIEEEAKLEVDSLVWKKGLIVYISN